MQHRLRLIADVLAAHRLVIYAFVGLSFLWPFYQRAFFRVTLFYQLGELAEPCFQAFLIVFLAGAASLGLPPVHRAVERVLVDHRSVTLTMAILSIVSTTYLSGLVVPAADGAVHVALDLLATIGYAISTLAVSALWLLLLMRIVYAKSLFSAVIVLVASGMAGCLLSPTFLTSALSTGIVPVLGIFLSGACAWLAHPLSPGESEPSYQALSTAPYLRTWLIPLVLYLFISILHAFGFANDASTEVHVLNGELAAANTSIGNYVVYFVFSCFLIAASAYSWSTTRSNREKATFWVALMGVSIGLFLGLFFADMLAGADMSESIAQATTTKCFIILLAVVVLFLTYQNRLCPLQTFGLFFIGAYTVEKVLAYLVFPVLFDEFGVLSSSTSQVANTIILAVSSAVMLLFLAKLCRSNALGLLFAVNDPGQSSETPPGAGDARREACARIAERHGLTKRELDILQHLALGHSAKRTGELLCISERTVQTHSQNIYRKLGVHNRQMVIDLVETQASEQERL